MKIVLNIEKKHLIFFSVFLVLVGSVFVIATTWTDWTPSKPYHDTLYTSIIGPKEDTVEVIFKKQDDNDTNKYKISSPYPDTLRYGTRGTRNIFRGEICSDENIENCISVSDLISSVSDLISGNSGGGSGGGGGGSNKVYAYGQNGDSWDGDNSMPIWNCNIKGTNALNLIYEKEFTGRELITYNSIKFVSTGNFTDEKHHLMLDAKVEKKVGNNWVSLTPTITGISRWIGDWGYWERSIIDRGSTTDRYHGCTINEECIRTGYIGITNVMSNSDVIKVKVIACGNYEDEGSNNENIMGYFRKDRTSVTLTN